MTRFVTVDRDTAYLLPPSVDDWLPKDHLARFVVEIVDQLDLSEITRQYRGSGSAAYHPTVMLGLLIYGYATGVYSSRRIEAATYESVAFRYIAANTQPDHDSLCTFRKRFLNEAGWPSSLLKFDIYLCLSPKRPVFGVGKISEIQNKSFVAHFERALFFPEAKHVEFQQTARAIEALFVQVLCIARQMKLLKLGTIALDGTKIHANASRHSALSYGHAQKTGWPRAIEAQLETEVKQLLARAEAADQEPLPEGLSIPAELARREERLAAIRQAKAQIEVRGPRPATAAERDAQEKADFDAKIKAREDRTARTGKKPGGKPPAPPRSGVRPTDQINLMALGQPPDADSRIMSATGKGFEQNYNAQAAVDTEGMLIVATGMAQVATDKQQVEPMLKALAGLPEVLGSVEQLLADNGYFSAANVEHCVQAKIEPLLAAGRDGHHPHWEDRFSEPPPLVEPASAVDRMKHRLKTVQGRKLYGLRKQTVEPVFGIMAQGHPVKSVMRFRQFLLRGLNSVRGEWNLVTMAWNIKRMAIMAG